MGPSIDVGGLVVDEDSRQCVDWKMTGGNGCGGKDSVYECPCVSALLRIREVGARVERCGDRQVESSALWGVNVGLRCRPGESEEAENEQRYSSACVWSVCVYGCSGGSCDE